VLHARLAAVPTASSVGQGASYTSFLVLGPSGTTTLELLCVVRSLADVLRVGLISQGISDSPG
jgi:hypothetical protein